MTPNQIDPLYTIFEQHLFNFHDSDMDRKTFIENVVRDYFAYLRKLSITVPKSLEGPVFEELAHQVSTMLVKKIYGCLTIQDYQKSVPAPARRRARTRYTRMSKNAERTSKTATSRASRSRRVG